MKPFTREHRERLSKALKGRKFSKMRRKRMGVAKIGSKNPMWKGNDVKKEGLHQWVKRRLEKPNLCTNCERRKPYDLANISGEYKRDINDYEWVCRSCHMRKDGRLKKFRINGEKGKRRRILRLKKLKYKICRSCGKKKKVKKFHRVAKNSWNTRSRCKLCLNRENRERYHGYI